MKLPSDFPRQPSRSKNEGCLPAALLLLSIVPLSVIHGAVLMKLWEWFVADPFGAREIGLPLAIGLTSIVTYLTVTPTNTEDSDESPWFLLAKAWVWRLSTAGIVLVEGLILTRWVS